MQQRGSSLYENIFIVLTNCSAPAAAGAPAAAADAPAEEAPKKEEAKEESDDDMGLGLFD